MTEKTRYCPSCGENVPVYEFAMEKGIELRCSFCSFPLDLETPQLRGAKGALIVADDAQTITTMVKDYFTGKQLFDPIFPASHGGEVLKHLVALWKDGKTVELVILDIKMPVLNGAQVAVAIRWLEKGFGILSPTPLIFLSGVRITEDLKKVMEYCQPSYYINKASGGSPDELLNRIDHVARSLLQPSRATR